MNFIYLAKKLFSSTYTQLRKILLVLISALILYVPIYAYAACSPYLGQATLNEFFKDQANMSYDADDFIEVKILDPSVTSAIFDSWTIRICEDNDPGNNNDTDGCSDPVGNPIYLSSFTTANYPWLILKGNIGRYVNFKTGFDAILLDANGDVIDYLSVDGYNLQEDADCTGRPPLQFDYQAAAPGASDKFIYRSPDGTGDWGSAPSASAPPSEEDTNDTAPGGGTPPIVSVTNVTVNKGNTATFTFTLEKTVAYDVTVDYLTFGGTAIADTDPQVTYDYVYKTGQIKFDANTTTLTQSVDILTNSINPSTNNTVYFYLKLFNQSNAKIINSYPIGTILGNAMAEWYMDEVSWNNNTNEVSDISSNAIHGTPYNNVTTVTPGKLCNAGSFDGNNDYIEIPHHPALIGTNQLTYSAWINPSSWSTSSINQVMSKSVHGGGSGRAQMGIFSENGRLVGRAETAAGRYEVFTSLPALSSWTHIMLIFNGNSLAFYINGELPNNISVTYPSFKMFTPTTLISNTDPLMISKRVGSNAYHFHGLIDEVLVMQSYLPGAFIKTMFNNYQLGLNWNGASRNCGGIDHFSINTGSTTGTGINCQAESIILTAHDASHNTFTGYTGTVTLSTSTANGDWSKTGTASDANGTLTIGSSDSGAATYTFVAGDNGSVILHYKNTHTETTNINTIATTITESSGSAVASDDYQITFSSTGFNFLADTVKNTITTQIAGKPSSIAPSLQSLELQAVKTSDDTGACEAAFTGATAIEIAFECIDPVNCTGDKLYLSTDGGTTFDQLDGTPELTYTTITDFDFGLATDTTAPLIIRYDDAGKIKLHARKILTPSTEQMTGQSNEFVVRPFALYPYITGNTAATSSAGAVFTSAGTDFTVNTRAVLWQAGDDDGSGGIGIANDGIADGHESTDTDPSNNVNLADNTVANNYGQEISTEQVLLSSLLNQPAGGNNPVLNDSSANGLRITSFNVTNGIGSSTTISYPEVGIIEITSNVNDSDYLGIGNIETTKFLGKSGFVGRFTPHHFDTVLTDGCTNIAPLTSFTYSGQPVTVQTIAMNNSATPAITQNYTDGFAKAVTLSSPTLVAGSFNGTDNILATDFVNGSYIKTDVTYTFSSKESGPDSTFTIRATDTEGITSNEPSANEGITNLRSGRARLENVFGSELTTLIMPLKIEFYSDNATPADLTDDGFVLNTDDTCTTYDATFADLTNYSGNLSAGETTVTGSGTVTTGEANITFSAPGTGNEGSVNLLLNGLSLLNLSTNWLSYNWNIDCDNADADNDITTGIDAGLCGPYGIASFGLYRGDDRIIYQREVFN